MVVFVCISKSEPIDDITTNFIRCKVKSKCLQLNTNIKTQVYYVSVSLLLNRYSNKNHVCLSYKSFDFKGHR